MTRANSTEVNIRNETRAFEGYKRDWGTNSNMQFIVFTGLPGTGKSRLAETIGQTVHIPVFAKDWLEGVLNQHGINYAFDTDGHQQPLGYVGYELLTTLALRQLQLQQSVILDSVASPPSVREKWREMANEYAAPWRVIECICSDENLHRQKTPFCRR